MVTILRRCSGLLFRKTLLFIRPRTFLALVKLPGHFIHTSCGIRDDFDKDQGRYKKVLQSQSDSDNNGIDEKHVDIFDLSLTEEQLSEFPIRRFTGNIYIIKYPSNEQDLEILNVLNKLKRAKVLGFDAEMTESQRRYGQMKRNKKTRVVQISSQTDAVVWQLKHFKTLPSSLAYFLESNILKVGHAISDDVVLLKKEFNIKSRCLFDTLPWAMQLNCKPLGLHGLCAMFLGWRISKGLRTSDWNRSELSENQINYACTDAWASLMLYNKMKSVALENGNQCPSSISSVNDILDTRLISKRKRRSRLVKNNKARKNFNLLVETALKIVE